MSTTWFRCKYCNRCFEYGRSLIDHKRSEHPNEYREAKVKRKAEKLKEDVDDDEQLHRKKLKNEIPDDSADDTRQFPRNGSSTNSDCVSDAEGSVCSGMSSCTTLSGSSAGASTSTAAQIKVKDKKELVKDISDSRNNGSDAEVTFTCKYCRDWYPQQILLNEHIMLVHLVDNTFKCLFCKKTYTNKGTRDAHELKVHPDEAKRENEKHKSSLQKEMNQRKLYECKICGVTYVDHLRYSNHIKKHGGARTSSVEDEDEETSSQSDDKKKMQRDSNYDYECDECHRCYQRQEQLLSHMKKSGHTSSTARTGGEESEDESTSTQSTTNETTISFEPNPTVIKRIPRALKSVPRRVSFTSKAAVPVSVSPKTVKISSESNKSLQPDKSISTSASELEESDRITMQKFQGSEVWVCNVCMAVNRHRHLALEHVRSSHHPIPESSGVESSQDRVKDLKDEPSTSTPSSPKHHKQSHDWAADAKSSQFLTSNVSENSKVTYMCNFCRRIFSAASLAVQHVVDHTGEKIHKCSCGSSFLTARDLQQHHKKLRSGP